MNKCILMCAAPGAGKTTLAKQLAKEHDAVVCSADDFHIWWGNGIYDWDGSRQGRAHDYCKYMFTQALSLGRNVIVDNTNTKLSEMNRYIELARELNYEIILKEPDTPWKYDAEECYKRNTHNVPLETIKRMIQNIQNMKESKEFKCLLQQIT